MCKCFCKFVDLTLQTIKVKDYTLVVNIFPTHIKRSVFFILTCLQQQQQLMSGFSSFVKAIKGFGKDFDNANANTNFFKNLFQPQQQDTLLFSLIHHSTCLFFALGNSTVCNLLA